MWKETTEKPENLRIFREEIDPFLPRRVLDFHCHICPREAVPAGTPWAANAGGHELPEYRVEELAADLAALFPGRECSAVCFGMPHRNLDIAGQNVYAARACDGKRFFPFRLLRPDDPPEAVERDVVEGGFLGFKPYHGLVPGKGPEEVTVDDMLPAALMEIADRRRLIVTLHVPRKGRFADPLNRVQVARLAERFPNATIVLAHVGRAYYLRNIAGSLEDVAGLPNVFYDLAMLNNWEVLEYLFARVPAERILFGTDMPISVAPGKSVEINDQYTYVTPVPWDLSIDDGRGRIRFTSFAYEEIRAIRKAVERLGLDRRFVEDIFFDSGMRLLERTKAAAGTAARKGSA